MTDLPRIAVFAVLACLLGALAGCQAREPAVSTGSAVAAAWAAITELQVTDVVKGAGPAAAPGATVEVHYEGWLYDPDVPDHKGRKFDTSRERGRPFRFQLGAGKVIKGWDEGVAGMQVGGKRQLLIPAQLGYGERGAGGGLIPPGAALLFDVELKAIE